MAAKEAYRRLGLGVCASGGPKAARKLTPQIEATCEHDGRI
jgi:hypothetical protein